MEFKVDDYFTGRAVYQIELYVTPLSLDDYKRIVEQFRYHCRKDAVSWICGYSTKESETAHTEFVHTGKRGRPRKMIVGSSTDGHQHNLLIGTESTSAYCTAHRIAKALNKKYGKHKKVCRVGTIKDGAHLCNSINYIRKQSDILRSGGDFDFQDYYDRTHELFC